MAIFILVQTDLADTEQLSQKIFELYGQDNYSLSTGSWLISTDDTAEGVSIKLGIKEGLIKSVVIVEAASYHGRANPAIWSWIKDKWEG